jgi:hypothetical protein
LIIGDGSHKNLTIPEEICQAEQATSRYPERETGESGLFKPTQELRWLKSPALNLYIPFFRKPFGARINPIVPCCETRT